MARVLDRGPESYAVTYASHALGTLDRFGLDKPGATEKGEDKEDDRKLFSTHGKTVVRSSQRRKQAEQSLVQEQTRLLDLQTDALRMTVELGGVHALHFGHAGLILPSVLNPDGIFEDIRPLGQVIQVEVRRPCPGWIRNNQARPDTCNGKGR